MSGFVYGFTVRSVLPPPAFTWVLILSPSAGTFFDVFLLFMIVLLSCPVLSAAGRRAISGKIGSRSPEKPPPDFRVAHHRTTVLIQGPRDFENMDREERVRACHQDCVLKWVMAERMTNQSLRERFHLPENKSASVWQIISAAIEGNLVKLDERVGGSR